MTEKKYEKYFLREPFGKVMRGGPGVKVPPGTPVEKPYWIGIRCRSRIYNRWGEVLY